MPSKIRFPPHVYFDPEWWSRCRISILILTDSTSGGYGSAGFHLGEILNILATDPWSHVEFRVTKAHRQTHATADVNGFRFDQHDLSQWDQIWLFGIERASGALGQSELKALAQFMDQGGGVFATGDHENLGLPLAAEVPRVRSMRRWYHPSAGPNGEPVAPDQTGPGRHDTLTDDPATAIVEADQSDAVPQEIRLRWYTRKSGGGFFYKVHRFPHPILCGPDGPIEYLPDHMHEGKCEAPTDVGKTYTFDGYACVEYPTMNGAQTRPQVVAWARSSADTTTDEFGVIAAYDGHLSGVGRVVVDATWHHWFNINLIGFVAATDPASPAYDPAVVSKWNAIKAYFRNVAAWLAPRSTQACLRNGGWLNLVKYYDIMITYRPLERVHDPLAYFWQLGRYGRDALGRFASQCQTTQWMVDLSDWLDIRTTPWPPVDLPPRPDPPPWLDLEVFETLALGGAVHALVEAFRDDERSAHQIAEAAGRKVEAIARRGAAAATLAFARHQARSAKEAERLARLADEVV